MVKVGFIWIAPLLGFYVVGREPLLKTVPVGHVGFYAEQRFAVKIDQDDLVKVVFAVKSDLIGSNLTDKASSKVLFRHGIVKDDNRMILDEGT